jgi:hypothetical protein
LKLFTRDRKAHPFPCGNSGEVPNSLFIREVRLVVVAGFVDFCRAALTYGSSRISATLGDVWSDVGNVGCERLVDTNTMKPSWFPHEKFGEG